MKMPGDFFVMAPCTTANGVEIRLNGRRIDLKKAEAAFVLLGEVVGSSSVVLLAKVDAYTLSVYASGRIMVKGKRRPAGRAASMLAEKILSAMQREGALI